MFEILGISSQALFGQLLIGLINGSFYALLSLGLAVIFGMLNIINFAHGAQYMMGAFVAIFLLQYLGLGYWWALVLAPIIVGASGIVIERLFLQWLYKLDHLYGLLLTFGLALIIEGTFRNQFGSSGLPYPMPEALRGGQNLGFMFLPNSRAWVIVASLAVCLTTWFVIERTRLGSYLRAATENPTLVRAFGINVPRMITLTYGFGVALAALAGVMAAPIYGVNPQMGANLIIVVFAVVVIGGMGSIMGAIVTGFGLGVIEGLTKVFFPEASNTVIFVIMAIVLLIRPAGLFGRGREMTEHTATAPKTAINPPPAMAPPATSRSEAVAFVLMTAILLVAPLIVYPVFLMKALCFALFACAFNLLLGYVGLLSFGHALFFGWASYASAHAAKVWGLPPELAILFGAMVAAGFGLIVGALAIRRQGIYFAMITLALAQMMFFFAVQAPFTGGEDGIQGVPRGRLFGLIDLADQTSMYFTVLAIFLGSFLIIYRIINSPFGEVLKAIRENEPRAISLGYRTDRYKLLAFVLSATFAGVAGATKAIVFQLASLTDVDWPMSGEVILMTLVGGLGTVFGPVVGAFFIVTLENYLTHIGQWVLVVQGMIFVACVLLFRRGIVGALMRLTRVKL
ncbi:MAG: branched-chain amino acid ABC transporter permease [Xanthobacteraceae bacterium]|nr:branched-chain amino acid ABC transporter permease [Xanthobacteraceae bacterium]